MPSVTFLGTGPGSGLAGRFQSSLLLEAAETRVLLDAGEPCTAQLLNLGIALPSLDAVWITHAHSDHTGGLPFLLQASWIHGRKESLPLGIPAYLVEPLAAWLRASLLPPEVLGFPLAPFAWQAGQPVTLGPLTVTPHPTTHLDRLKVKMADSSIEAFLFEIQSPQFRLLYTGDIGSPADLTPHLDRPVDVLICELGHFLPEDLAATLAPAQIGSLCLTHLSRVTEERRGQLKVFFAEKLSATDAIYLPDDGERVEF